MLSEESEQGLAPAVLSMVSLDTLAFGSMISPSTRLRLELHEKYKAFEVASCVFW